MIFSVECVIAVGSIQPFAYIAEYHTHNNFFCCEFLTLLVTTKCHSHKNIFVTFLWLLRNFCQGLYKTSLVYNFQMDPTVVRSGSLSQWLLTLASPSAHSGELITAFTPETHAVDVPNAPAAIQSHCAITNWIKKLNQHFFVIKH